MRRLSRGAKVAVIVSGVIVALLLLYFLFEWAGALLDSGGAVVGASP